MNGAAEVAILRSTQAHARLVAVDLAPALALDGVIDAFAADALGEPQVHEDPGLPSGIRDLPDVRPIHLDRGFERLEEKLARCGAEIERISD